MRQIQKRKRSPDSKSDVYEIVRTSEEISIFPSDNRIQIIVQLVSVIICLMYQYSFQDSSKKKLRKGVHKNISLFIPKTKNIKNIEDDESLKHLLNFRRTIEQNTFVLPVSLETYFESLSSGNSLSQDESMSNNLLRLSSFSNFPSNVNIFASQFSKAGFYYTGSSDEVRCYACGVTYRNWKSCDKPQDIHKRLSPSCPHVNNLTISCDEEKNRLTSASNQRRDHYEAPSATSNSFASPPIASFPANTVSEVQGHTSDTQKQANLKDFSNNKEQLKPHSAQNSTGLPLSNSATNDLLPQKNKTGAAENENTSSHPLTSMGINIDKPKYPNYAAIQVRISSFQGWPSYLDQTPRDMAAAGFMFAGYNDYTRCFFCGGGLRNWEAGDDPWVEHARWFPKCAYLLQNKGDKFINAVQKKHQELSSPTETMAPLNSRPSYQINSPLDTVAAKSVLEMGYSGEQVLDAIKQITARRDYKDLSATLILAVLLQDDRDSMAIGNSVSISGGDNQPKTSALENGANDLITSFDDSKLDDTETLLEENRQLKYQRLCKICLDLEASIAFLPCGHLVCCADCAPAMRKCPMCRAFVKGTVKTFLI